MWRPSVSLRITDPETAKTRNNLGILVIDQGEFAAARKYLEEALQIRRQVLGNEHPDTAAGGENLAWLAQKEGAFAQAGKSCDESRRMVANLQARYAAGGVSKTPGQKAEQTVEIHP